MIYQLGELNSPARYRRGRRSSSRHTIITMKTGVLSPNLCSKIFLSVGQLRGFAELSVPPGSPRYLILASSKGRPE